MYQRSQRWMLIINNRFLSLYDYNFLLMIEKNIYSWIPDLHIQLFRYTSFFIIFLSIFFLSNDLSISEISFKVIKKGSSDRRFIWLHGDEQTARMALDDHMSNGQGIAYYIKNDKTRDCLLYTSDAADEE